MFSTKTADIAYEHSQTPYTLIRLQSLISSFVIIFPCLTFHLFIFRRLTFLALYHPNPSKLCADNVFIRNVRPYIWNYKPLTKMLGAFEHRKSLVWTILEMPFGRFLVFAISNIQRLQTHWWGRCGGTKFTVLEKKDNSFYFTVTKIHPETQYLFDELYYENVQFEWKPYAS